MESLFGRCRKPFWHFCQPVCHLSEILSAFLSVLSPWCISHRIAMETYIRQRQLIISPLMPSRVIGENEPLTAVFNKVIATREVNHKGQGKLRALIHFVSCDFKQAALKCPFSILREMNHVCGSTQWISRCLPHWISLHVYWQGCLWPWSCSLEILLKSGRTSPTLSTAAQPSSGKWAFQKSSSQVAKILCCWALFYIRMVMFILIAYKAVSRVHNTSPDHLLSLLQESWGMIFT